MTKKWVGLGLAFGLMVACDNAGGLGTSAGGPNAPPGVDISGQAVDPMIVGHRLMEAGEYELALKSFKSAAAEQGLNADVLSAIGSANLQLGRLGQAEDLLRRATKADETSAPAWNNLGVVLMEQDKIGEAARVFRIAFALDSGESVEIRENLRLALANLDNSDYSEPEKIKFALVRGEPGQYRLQSKP